MSERAGVEVDYCPSCRGVWLDRGELDKIIAKSVAEESGAAPAGPSGNPGMPPAQTFQQPQTFQQQQQPQHQQQQYPGYDPRRDNDDSKYGYPTQWGQQGKPYKKKSLLKELFDF